MALHQSIGRGLRGKSASAVIIDHLEAPTRMIPLYGVDGSVMGYRPE